MLNKRKPFGAFFFYDDRIDETNNMAIPNTPTADAATPKDSKVKIYSLGYAGANLSFGERELEVVPIEDLDQLDGEVTDMMGQLDATGVDKDGNTFATSQKVSNTIRAMYLPLDAHRPYPSLIRRGERVLIWRVADTDKYYWTEMGLDDTTRRKDVFTILVPNSPTEGENSKIYKTAYYIEVNTVDKHITIQTNKNDGEEFAYLLQLNPGGGSATLCDDAGNYFQLLSKEKKLMLMNAVGSSMGIEGNKGWFTAKESITCNTKDFNVNCTNYNVKTANYNMSASAGCNMTSSGSYAVKASSFTHNGINVGESHKHSGVRSGGEVSSTPV